jgi:hypothetical protein
VIARSTTDLPIPADLAWRIARKTSGQLYLNRLIFAYADDLPEIRSEGYTVETRVKLMGFIPAWKHHQRFARIDDEKREMLVQERAGLYDVWDHLMRVEPLGDTRCRFLDQIEVAAGPLTPVVWASAAVLCAIRMRRLRELARVLSSVFVQGPSEPVPP